MHEWMDTNHSADCYDGKWQYVHTTHQNFVLVPICTIFRTLFSITLHMSAMDQV